MKAPAMCLAAVAVVACSSRAQAQIDSVPAAHEPVVGLPCEGCEAAFVGMPDQPKSVARIAPQDESGEPLRIEGVVYDLDGQPAPGIVVYAYHPDARGIYPPDEAMRGTVAFRHGRLRGWVRTDEAGRYRFETIRPAGYPDSPVPSHVHMHVIEPGCCTYYIASLQFKDDPRLGRELQEGLTTGRGGSGLVQPTRTDEGVWVAVRDIHLGQDVPDYPKSKN